MLLLHPPWTWAAAGRVGRSRVDGTCRLDVRGSAHPDAAKPGPRARSEAAAASADARAPIGGCSGLGDKSTQLVGEGENLLWAETTRSGGALAGGGAESRQSCGGVHCMRPGGAMAGLACASAAREEAKLGTVVWRLAAVAGMLQAVLDDNSADAARIALTVVLAMMDNVLRSPDEAKFRRIKLANATFRSKVASAVGAIELLGSLGFVESEPGVLVLPSEVDLARLALARQEITNALNSARMQPMAAPSTALLHPAAPTAPAVLQPAASLAVAARALEASTSDASSFRVELLVYDLSGGAARGLSAALLGFEVDIIPHTGLLVHGVEYYFSGGVQREPTGAFSARSSIPIHCSIPLGHTEVPPAVFYEFCFELGLDRFHADSYNLLSNNCNHFTHACAEFLLEGGGIPADILHLPSRVLATPMGQMLRPMLEAMGRPMNDQLQQACLTSPLVSGGQGGVIAAGHGGANAVGQGGVVAPGQGGAHPAMAGRPNRGATTQAGLIAPAQGRGAVAYTSLTQGATGTPSAAGAPLFSGSQIENMLAVPAPATLPAAPSTPFPPFPLPPTPVHGAAAGRAVTSGVEDTPRKNTSGNSITGNGTSGHCTPVPRTVANGGEGAPRNHTAGNGMAGNNTPQNSASGNGTTAQAASRAVAFATPATVAPPLRVAPASIHGSIHESIHSSVRDPIHGSIHNGMVTPSHAAASCGAGSTFPSTRAAAPPPSCYRTPMAGGPLARASCPLLACEGETAKVIAQLLPSVICLADAWDNEINVTDVTEPVTEVVSNTATDPVTETVTKTVTETVTKTVTDTATRDKTEQTDERHGERLVTGPERRAFDNLVICLGGYVACPAPPEGISALSAPDAAALGVFFSRLMVQIGGSTLFLLLYVSRLLSPNPAFNTTWLDSGGVSRLLWLLCPSVRAQLHPLAPTPRARVTGAEPVPPSPSPGVRVMAFLCASNLVASTFGLLNLASRGPPTDIAHLIHVAFAAAGPTGPAAVPEARAAAALLQNFAISLRAIGPHGAAHAPPPRRAPGLLQIEPAAEGREGAAPLAPPIGVSSALNLEDAASGREDASTVEGEGSPPLAPRLHNAAGAHTIEGAPTSKEEDALTVDGERPRHAPEVKLDAAASAPLARLPSDYGALNLEGAAGGREDASTVEAGRGRYTKGVKHRDAVASAPVLDSIRHQLLCGVCAPLGTQDDPHALQRLVVCLGSLVAEILDGTALAPPLHSSATTGPSLPPAPAASLISAPAPPPHDQTVTRPSPAPALPHPGQATTGPLPALAIAASPIPATAASPIPVPASDPAPAPSAVGRPDASFSPAAVEELLTRLLATTKGETRLPELDAMVREVRSMVRRL